MRTRDRERLIKRTKNSLTLYKTFHQITDVTCNISLQLIKQLHRPKFISLHTELSYRKTDPMLKTRNTLKLNYLKKIVVVNSLLRSTRPADMVTGVLFLTSSEVKYIQQTLRT